MLSMHRICVLYIACTAVVYGCEPGDSSSETKDVILARQQHAIEMNQKVREDFGDDEILCRLRIMADEAEEVSSLRSSDFEYQDKTCLSITERGKDLHQAFEDCTKLELFRVDERPFGATHFGDTRQSLYQKLQGEEQSEWLKQFSRFLNKRFLERKNQRTESYVNIRCQIQRKWILTNGEHVMCEFIHESEFKSKPHKIIGDRYVALDWEWNCCKDCMDNTRWTNPKRNFKFTKALHYNPLLDKDCQFEEEEQRYLLREMRSFQHLIQVGAQEQRLRKRIKDDEDNKKMKVEYKIRERGLERQMELQRQEATEAKLVLLRKMNENESRIELLIQMFICSIAVLLSFAFIILLKM